VKRIDDVRDFLMSRRARLSPEEAGLPAHSGNRRVEGLRRAEVAALAGVSVDYYTRLERGNLRGVSEGVLNSLVRTLKLDMAEAAYLFNLARAANASGAAPRPETAEQVRPTIQRTLDALTGAPAWVRNGRFDFLAANDLGHALYADLFDGGARPPSYARYLFLDPRSKDFCLEWESVAHAIVSFLRSEAGRDPHDCSLTALIGELSTQSEEFRRMWASNDVRFHRSGRKLLHHSVVGRLDLAFEVMELPADPGLVLVTYTAEPGSPSDDALSLLASWSARHNTADTRSMLRPAGGS
jgi:transcriptional regulator with XRE-family HTH domain